MKCRLDCRVDVVAHLLHFAVIRLAVLFQKTVQSVVVHAVKILADDVLFYRKDLCSCSRDLLELARAQFVKRLDFQLHIIFSIVVIK